MSTSGRSGSAGPIQTATAHVHGAAIGTLSSAPVTVVAAPGANKILAVVGGLAEFAFQTVAYNQVVSLALYYTDGTAGHIASNDFSNVTEPHIPEFSAVEAISPNLGSYVQRSLAVNAPLVLGNSVDGIMCGPILGLTIGAAGIGYALNDTGTIGPDATTGDDTATYKVTGVGALGIVTAVQLTGAGSAYALINNPQPTVTGGAQPGAGANLTLNATAIPAADGDLYVTVYYTIIALH